MSPQPPPRNKASSNSSGGGGGGGWHRAPMNNQQQHQQQQPPLSSRPPAALAALGDTTGTPRVPTGHQHQHQHHHHTPSPGGTTGTVISDHHGGGGGQEAAGGGGGGSSWMQGQNLGLRLRRDSTDSTRGAFYTATNGPHHALPAHYQHPGYNQQEQQHGYCHPQPHPLSPVAKQQRKQQKQKSPKRSPNNSKSKSPKRRSPKSASSNGDNNRRMPSSLADLADLAVTSLDDTEGHVGLAPATPSLIAPSNEKQQQPQQKRSFLQRNEGTLQADTRSNAPPNGGLETIRDESYATLDEEGGGGSGTVYGSKYFMHNSSSHSSSATDHQSPALATSHKKSHKSKSNNSNNNYGSIAIPEQHPPSRFSMASDFSNDSLRFSLDDIGGVGPSTAAQDAAAAVSQLAKEQTTTGRSRRHKKNKKKGGNRPLPSLDTVDHDNNNNNMMPDKSKPLTPQDKDIAFFSSMVQQAAADDNNYYHDMNGSSSPQKEEDQDQQASRSSLKYSENDGDDEDDDDDDDDSASEYEFEYDYDEFDDGPVVVDNTIGGRIMHLLDPTDWLMRDVQWTEDGTTPYFEGHKEWTTLAGHVRHHLYNPISPEFTSLQQFNWAIIVGIVMGIYTAVWKTIIETGVDFVWETVPEWLLEHGVFTELNGSFPLYHYMWICPTIFSAILSYIFVILPNKIPGQNEWINSLHTRGVQDYRTFWPLFILSTMGMLSGLSLGPELPLILTSGMFGSWLGLICKQSMLQARVLNLTAAAAAIGGFFGFPMAGALFVLEVPHRMGLQYFEALSPATISSIVAVICNRLVTNNDVTGYFKYPFLTETLPSQIFTHAIFYGLYGAAIGIAYTWGVLEGKHVIHDMFHAPHDHDDEDGDAHGGDDDQGQADTVDEKDTAESSLSEEMTPLNKAVFKKTSRNNNNTSNGNSKRIKNILACLRSYFCLVIPDPAIRASVSGAVAGLICGVVAIFVPHTLFWGEAQLQNLIDKGRTPLPVFGQGTEPTADFLALGYCLIDPSDKDAIKAGFSLGCAALISITKTIVIGVSLGTGIIGGHFWGPLFVGCAASHFLSDVVTLLDEIFGMGGGLATYPCVIMLCTMGAAHVVTFRAHTAIMLILTLTISAFSPEDGNPYYSIAGDYSAVFPLLVISVFISLMISRSTVFYKEQRSRGDITAVPEVLCEPGMEGRPLVAAYEPSDESCSSGRSSGGSGPDDSVQDLEVARRDSDENPSTALVVKEEEDQTVGLPTPSLTQEDIEDAFEQATKKSTSARQDIYNKPIIEQPDAVSAATTTTFTSITTNTTTLSSIAPPPPVPRAGRRQHQHSRAMTLGGPGDNVLSSARLDELLSMPMEFEPIKTMNKFDQSSSPPSSDAAVAGSPTTNKFPAPPSMVTGGLLPPTRRSHRRTKSAPVHPDNIARAQAAIEKMEQESIIVAATAERRTSIFDNIGPARERANSNSSRNSLVRVTSFGELQDQQPSLMDQARMRAASSAGTSSAAIVSRHQRKPSLPSGRHSRKNSAAKIDMSTLDDGALSFDEIERSFNNVAKVAFSTGSPWSSGKSGSSSNSGNNNNNNNAA